MNIYVKKVEGLTLPIQGSAVSAGYDIIATSNPKIVGQKYTPVGMESSEQGNLWNSVDYIEYETNLYIAPSAVTFHTLIHPRSSISKYNLVLANSIGLIDNDYRGMVICRFKYQWQPEDMGIIQKETGNVPVLINVGIVNMYKIYNKGDRIAQLVFEPTVQATFELVDDLQATQRGEGGFGSTGQSTKPVEMLPSSHPAVKVPSFVRDIAGLYQTATEGVPNRPKTYSEVMRERQMGR